MQGEGATLYAVCVQELTFHRVGKKPGHHHNRNGGVEIGLVKVAVRYVAWLKKIVTWTANRTAFQISLMLAKKCAIFEMFPLVVLFFSCKLIGRMTSQCLLIVIPIGGHFYMHTVIFAL